jgi:hypothetical protein
VAKLGVELGSLQAQGGDAGATEAIAGAAFARGFLQGGQFLADGLDDAVRVAVEAELDRELAAGVAVGETVVGAEGAIAAAAVGGDDGSLANEEVGVGGKEGQGRMALVNRFCGFQFGGSVRD